MKNKGKKFVVIGIVAAVAVLALLLGVLMTQCVGSTPAATTTAASAVEETEPYFVYWNLDKEEYAGKSEAGMSSRLPASDGYFYVRFFLDGEIVTLKAADRKIINKIDSYELMGLEIDENGIVVDVIDTADMPLETVGWRFYVQSAARTMLKLNSSQNLNGMEILLEDIDSNRVWDMTGRSGEKGCVAEAIQFDRVMVITDLDGNVTHVFLIERPYYMKTHEAYCQHCDKEVSWNEWVQTENVPVTAGHYQLQNDVQLKGQASMHEDAKICLDLNGFRIDGKEGSRVYSVHNPGGALAVMDTSEGQTGVVAAHGKTNAGGSCLWPRYGALYLYSGTVDASDVITTGNGAAVYVPKNSYFYMFGGTIIGGTAAYTKNPDNNTYGAGLGGNVFVAGKFVMHDGEILDGYAEAASYMKNGTRTYSRGCGGNIYMSGTAEFEMNGGVIKNGKAGNSGGNIYADGGCTITINGGAIQGGRGLAKGKNGGSIFLTTKSTTVMNGGSITGGVSNNGGGNVYVNGKLTINGGLISGGKCYSSTTGKINEESPNYNIMMVNGQLRIYGGRIVGGVSATDSVVNDGKKATVVLGSYATIDGAPNGRNLYLSASGEKVKLVVSRLHEKASIGVYTTTGLFSEPTEEVYLKNFHSDIEDAEVVYHDGRLGLGRLSCVCGKETHTVGCDGEVLLWAPWMSETSIPKATGNYYLLKDATVTSQTVVTAGLDVKLDLNGKNITYNVKPSSADGFRLYRAEEGGQLTITDTTENPGTLRTVMPGADAVYPGTTTNSVASKKDENGNIVERVYYTEEEMRAFWAKANSGMVLWSRGGTINVYNGIFDGSNLSGASTGMVVYVNNRTVTDSTTGEKTFYQGQMNIYGGTFIGGYTHEKGNVAVAKDAQLAMYGGTIRDGRANQGGNVHVEGTMYLYGGAILDGVVDRSLESVDGGQGGNVNIAAGATLEMSGGKISGGYVKGGKNGGGQGGNIHVYGTLNATGGVISDGDAYGGGNIGTISADSVIRLKNVQVLDGVADGGGNILIGVRSNKGLELLEGTVIAGGHARSAEKAGNGGNIAVNLSSNTRDQEQVILIDGAIIRDGTSAGTGGNIRVRNLSADAFNGDKQTHYCVNVKIVMRSGTISGGSNDTNRTDSSVQNGGSVYLSENSQFILEGGTVEGGDCSDGGGNFYVNGTLDVRGGTVKSGTRNGVSHASSNIFVVGGKLLLSGGKVEGNATVSGTSRLVLFGKPVVTGENGGITLKNDILFEIDGLLESGASVHTSGRGYISKAVQSGNEAFLHSVDGYSSNYVDGRVFFGKVSCLCGGTTHTAGCIAAMAELGLDPTRGDKLAMLPLTEAADMASGGYWYLPKSVTSGAVVYIQDNKPLALDFNGNTLTVNHNSFFLSSQKATSKGVLIVTDTVGGGGVKQVSSKTLTAQGGILRISGASGNDVAYVLGGTLDATGYQLQSKLAASVLYITNGNTVKQYGGTLVGRADAANLEAGATVHVKQGKFELLGGTITGGNAKNGGNVYVDANGVMTMSGGTVTGGSASTEGDNIYVLGSFTMQGGTTSGVYAASNAVAVTANATVEKGESAYGMKIADGKTIDVAGLTGKLSVTAATGKAFAHGGNAAQAEAIVTSEVAGQSVVFYEADYLYMGKAMDVYCICGATIHGGACQDDGKVYRWSDWSATDSLPTDSGYYRLTATVNVDAAKVVTLNAQQIYLDLAGQTVNLEDGENIYNFTQNAGAKVVITDSSANAGGKIVLTGTHTANGGFADIFVGNTVELYRATLDASYFATAENGAVFAVRGSFVMHSGTVIGGDATGSKKNGGALWMAKGSQVTIHDGTVIGGEAGRWGGAIYVTGAGTVLTMNGGTVSGGEAAENGGAIIVRDSGVFNMNGGTITGGKTVGAGKNLFVDGTGVFTMNGGTITGGVLINGNGATITGSAVIDKRLAQTNAPAISLEIASGMQVDLTDFNGLAYVTAQPGEVFAIGADSLAETKVCSETVYKGFDLPVLAKDGKLFVDTADAVHCICGASLHGYACQDDGTLYYWQSWTQTNTMPAESGYYRLTADVELTTTAKLTTAEKIYLDFNGFTVNQKDMSRLYNLTKNVASVLVLTDSSKDAKGGAVITGTRTDSNGGFLDLQAGNTLELYRATLDASAFYIAGGNGTAISSRGNIVMHSGTIKGGRLDSGTKHGATLWLTDSSQTVVKDGLIVGGRAGRWAGTVYIAAANTYFKLEGGRVEGGTADELGGSFMVRNGTLHITGGTITGGTVTNGEGSNICIQTSGTLNMEGGTVTGGVYIASDAKAVNVSGSAVIDKSLGDCAYSLKLAAGKTVNVTGLTGKVYVTAEVGKTFATGATAAMAEVNVLSEVTVDETAVKVLFVEPNKLHMGTVYCVCGATLHDYACQDDGTLYTWTEWNQTNALPTASGWYRLTEDIDMTTAVKITTEQTIYLDLNGHTINVVNGNRLYNLTKGVAATIVITDTSRNATGKVVVSGTSSGINGGILNLEADHNLALYRATLDASGLKCTGGNGAAIASRGSIVMYSGTIIGGKLDSGTKHGATMWLVDGSQTVMKDGLIKGGTSGRWGGVMYINAAKTLFKMEGGRIEGGTSELLAGSLMVRSGATFHMTGGTVTGGVVTNGGDGFNVYVNDTSSVFKMEGGTIHGGVYSANNVTITGNAVIDKSLTDSSKYTVPAYSLKLASGKTANVDGLAGTVYVSGSADAVFATGATAAMAENNVRSDSSSMVVALTQTNKLMLTAK